MATYLLVGLIGTLWVSDLGLEVVLLLVKEVLRSQCQQGSMIHRLITYPDTNEIGELGISVDVHLNDTIANSSLDLLFRRTGSTMEDEEPGK